MLNLLVVEDNFYYSKSLINTIISNNKIRLYNIATNGKETIEILKNYSKDIDIILLNLQSSQFNELEILKFLEDNNMNKYYHSVIVISGEMELLKKVVKNKFLYTFIPRESGLKFIKKEINKLVEMKDYSKLPIKEKAKQELYNLNYNFKYIGTKYILEAILILYQENNYDMVKIEKNIYSIIAQKYHTTINNVKTNIIHATNEMYYDCEEEKLYKNLGIVYGEKPKPKMIIYRIIENLK